MPNQKWDPEWEPSALAMLPSQFCSLHLFGSHWLEEAALLHSKILGRTNWDKICRWLKCLLQAVTAGPLLAAQSDFSVPEVLKMPSSIYRNKATTCQHKLSITEDWDSCSTSDKSITAGYCCRLNFRWFKVQLQSSGVMSPGQADVQTVIVWLYEPWMDMPPDASNSTASCPLLLSTWLLDAVGNLSGETLMLQPLGSVSLPGSTCSAQQCPCPAARLPSSQRCEGHRVPWLYWESRTKMQTAELAGTCFEWG